MLHSHYCHPGFLKLFPGFPVYIFRQIILGQVTPVLKFPLVKKLQRSRFISRDIRIQLGTADPAGAPLRRRDLHHLGFFIPLIMSSHPLSQLRILIHRRDLGVLIKSRVHDIESHLQLQMLVTSDILNGFLIFIGLFVRIFLPHALGQLLCRDLFFIPLFSCPAPAAGSQKGQGQDQGYRPFSSHVHVLPFFGFY